MPASRSVAQRKEAAQRREPEETAQDAARDAEEQRLAFGARLRALRRSRSMTLAALSERSGLSIATLSKAERGLVALTYDRMALLANGLDVDMSELFSEGGARFAQDSLSLARKGDYTRYQTSNYVYEMLFTDLRHKAMTPMLGSLKAHDILEFDDFVRHEGEEFLMVLEGKVTVFLENRPPVTLLAGDSLYFDSAMGHLYASAGDQDARILVVCANP